MPGNKKFHVAIVHGHSKAWKSIKNYVKEMGYTPRVLKEELGAEIILERFAKMIWDDIHCVIVILTGDDVVANGKWRARQNVIFELGYCIGAFDAIKRNSLFTREHAIIILQEEGIELFADIEGITRIIFKKGKISPIKKEVFKSVQATYLRAKKYYKL